MSGQYLSNDALCGDMVRCAVERNMGNRFENGQLKYIDVVHLVQASDNQGSIADKDDQQNVNRRLRRKLKGYLATLPESNAACFNNTDISISLLPGIVQFFCNTTFTMEQVHTIAKPMQTTTTGLLRATIAVWFQEQLAGKPQCSPTDSTICVSTPRRLFHAKFLPGCCGNDGAERPRRSTRHGPANV